MRHKTKLQFIALGSVLLLGACVPKTVIPAPAGDTTAPTLSQVTPVPNSNNTTPSYTFSSDEAGTITYGGDCSSATTTAISGNNTITFNALSVAIHSNCTVKVTDATTNQSAILSVSAFMVGKPINDTGITLCGDYAYPDATHNNDVDCLNGTSPSSTKTSQGTEIANGLDPVPAGQDAVYGRDANALTNSDADGHKGFSYTKLKADGTALVDQTQAWGFDGSGFDNGTEAGGTNWSCVKDNVTGLIWEVKTNKSTADYRDKDATYTWYNSDATKNGGNAGTSNGGSCFNAGNCDTQKFVAYVNTQNLCGANTDWRMPTKKELQTIVAKDRVYPAIDTTFIPNTVSFMFWSASSYSNFSLNAWFVSFYDGLDDTYGKDGNLNVRLVRGGQ